MMPRKDISFPRFEIILQNRVNPENITVIPSFS
jgi:hypothetical protein